MPNYLIGYVDAEKNNGHEDPMLSEFTYGDLKTNGGKLLGLKKGDILFFHKSIYDKRFITAYYYVEEVDLVRNLMNDPFISKKFNNPHLKKHENQLDDNETIVFGNPIRSKILDKPLEITPILLNQLSKKANLNPKLTPLAAISSALRTWKELSDEDVRLLLRLINENEKSGRLSNTTLSSEEVFQILERDIEKLIAGNPKILGEGLILEKQQYIFSDDSRLDLLLHDKKNDCRVVVEIKKGKIGREAKQQIKHYMKMCQKELGYSNIKGIIVCAGILPYFESELLDARKENIFVKTFGWKFHINN
ncbi:MAG: endonuclease NucS [Thermoanaerobacterium sp.]|nr:endonuclease NucS [Thermoanaerobacterium sp.]